MRQVLLLDELVDGQRFRGFNLNLLLWSFLAMLASGSLGLLLLRSVGLTGAPVWADIFVTGLAIGSGTKPLHDLISNLQQSSSQKEASAAQ